MVRQFVDIEWGVIRFPIRVVFAGIQVERDVQEIDDLEVHLNSTFQA